jgi:tRNA (guanine-N7-)-methyltransferase
MSRILKTDIPGRDFRVQPDQVYGKGWEEVFAEDLRSPFGLEVDIGFGLGEFVMDRAAAYPDVAFVGVELVYKRVLKMARRLAKTKLTNIRLVEGFAESAIEELFQASTVHRFWINFPDPWPKERHARRRLIQADFVHELAQRLVPGGELHVATDDAMYADQICEVLSSESLLENAFAPDPWRSHAIGQSPTRFEMEWRSDERPLHFFTYRMRASS